MQSEGLSPYAMQSPTLAILKACSTTQDAEVGRKLCAICRGCDVRVSLPMLSSCDTTQDADMGKRIHEDIGSCKIGEQSVALRKMLLSKDYAITYSCILKTCSSTQDAKASKKLCAVFSKCKVRASLPMLEKTLKWLFVLRGSNGRNSLIAGHSNMAIFS
ncbi:hypothetical protein L7F22_062180 [Adiantum nelumboides]|nr:hypothetical protein [Adiantum nelumboides]